MRHHIRTVINDSAFLSHHGIKGQKWGVRRYQNSDGSLTTEGKERYSTGKKYTKNLPVNNYTRGADHDRVFEKGFTFQRIASENDINRKGRTYVSYTETDNAGYILESAWEKDGLKATHKYELTALKDIKVAGYKTRVESFIETIKDVPFNELASKFNQNRFQKQSSLMYAEGLSEAKKLIKSMSRSKKSFEKLYDQFNYNIYVNRDDPLVKKYFGILKSKGFDAIRDDYDFGNVYNPSSADYANSIKFVDPIIVIDRVESLMTTGIGEITYADVETASKIMSDAKRRML